MPRNPFPDLRGVPVAPLTGPLDLRSPANEIGQQSLRMRQNLQAISSRTLRRGTGYQKLLPRTPYNNSDFHDQLLTFTNGIRQPITMLYENITTRHVKTLFLGTQNAIAKLNEHSANWQILGSGYGGTPSTSAAAHRFHAAGVGDFVAFTNNFNKPLWYLVDAGTGGAPLLSEFDDLATIGLTRATVIWSWRNVLFFADVEMDGQRYGYRVLWSDYNNPLGFDPANLQSITGFKDLYTHETILGGAPLGNSFLIYTTHGIWEMVVVGGDQSFDFVRRYNGEENQGAAVLKYPNTLAALPDAHIYGAEDGLYVFSPYYGKPERLEWLHLATLGIYDNIDAANCTVHVAEYSGNELLVSTASVDAPNNCPNRSLRVNMVYRCADVVDAGFTAFVTHNSFDVPTIRDFIYEHAICPVPTCPPVAGVEFAGGSLLGLGLSAIVPAIKMNMIGASDLIELDITATNVPELDGLVWAVPCGADAGPGICNCVDPADQVTTVSGAPGQLYDVTIRLRGVVELKNYTGFGAIVPVVAGDPNYFFDFSGTLTGGGVWKPTDPRNEYSLLIDNPNKIYFLNNSAGGTIDQINKFDYTVTVQMQTGATVRLRVRSIDNQERKNDLLLVVNNAPPPIAVSEPYNGEFIQMDVVAIAAH